MQLKEKKNQKPKKTESDQQRRNKRTFQMLLRALDYVEFIPQKEQFLVEVLENAKKVEVNGVVTRVVEEEGKAERGSQINDIAMSHSLESDSQPEGLPTPGTPVLINPRQPIKDPVTKKRLKRCANKLCGREGYGNNGWSRRKLCKGQFFWLCGSCSDAYKNNQYCDFCRQIYMESEEHAESDGKEWIQCEQCEKWVHTDCEIRQGYQDLQKLLDDGECHEISYFCVGCRAKKQNSLNNKYETSTPPTSKTPDFANLALAITDSQSDSEDWENPNLAKQATADSLSGSQSTSERGQLSREGLSKSKLKQLEKQDKRSRLGKSTPPLASQRLNFEQKLGQSSKLGKCSVSNVKKA